jgi:hypothetical protein
MTNYDACSPTTVINFGIAAQFPRLYSHLRDQLLFNVGIANTEKLKHMAQHSSSVAIPS